MIMSFQQLHNEVTRLVDAITSGGGGGGSTVSVTAIRTDGENIADITVNGTVNHIYAPNDAEDIAYDEDNSVADELSSINTTIGDTDISEVGDSVTDAISSLNDTLNKRYTLIWENSSPTAEFVAQTITLTDTSYEFIRIECAISDSSTGQDLLVNEDVRAGKGCDLLRIVKSTTTAYFSIRQRRVTYNTDGTVVFEDCYTQTPTTVATLRNDNVIPQRIYGIK